MATLDEINSGYVSAEDEDFVPDATVMQEAAARAAQRVQAAKSQSTAELIRARKAKSSAASMWAAMRGEDTAPVASSTAKPEDSKGAQAPTDDGKGGKKKKKTKGNKTHKESTKKGSGGKKKRRRAKDILAMLNRPSKAKGAKAKQVVANILGGRVVRRAKKRRVSSVAMPTLGAVPGGKVVVSEVVKFAGKAMTVTKAVSAEEARKQEAKQAAATRRVSGIDAAVDAMKDVSKINTVDKSSMDWETYKVETGIGDEVEQAAKNGYVGKQEFLTRVDQRQYSLELEERKRQRAAAAAAQEAQQRKRP